MDLNSVKIIYDSSIIYNTWCIELLGGSILTFLSTSYVQPVQRWAKLIYLLFIPAWYYIKLVIDCSTKISGNMIMANINPEKVKNIIVEMNDNYADLQKNFENSTLFFGLWLILYLSIWIYQGIFSSNKTI